VKFSRITALFVLVISSLFVLQACQDNNFVGSSFIPETSPVVVDTITLDQFEHVNLNSFTGNLPRFSAGQYNDPLFGTIRSEAFFTPGLISDTLDVSRIKEYYILFKANEFYGDTTAVAEFELHYVTERWRASMVNTSTQLPTMPTETPVTFSIGAEMDSVEVRIPQQWVDRYVDIFESEDRENRILNEEFGFLIRPAATDESKLIVGFVAGQAGTRIIVRDLDLDGGMKNEDEEEEEEEEEEDTSLMIPFRGWGFNMTQNAPADLKDRIIPVMNTFTDALRIDFDFSQFADEIITRVELIFYEDSLALSQDMPENHVRLQTNRLNMYLLSDLDTDFLVISNPAFTPERRTNVDKSYRVSLTDTIKRLILGGTFNGKYYITSQFNNGLLFPYALVAPDNAAQPDRTPKIVVTYIKPETN
jgi:hypothetical protein